MINYSIKYEGINDDKNCFYYSLNSKTNKTVILRVYNSYLNYKEYDETIELTPNIKFWTYIPSNNSNRYVEFRDLESCKFWVWEYLQTSNIWKNHNMKIEIRPTTKTIIYYYAEQ